MISRTTSQIEIKKTLEIFDAVFEDENNLYNLLKQQVAAIDSLTNDSSAKDLEDVLISVEKIQKSVQPLVISCGEKTKELTMQKLREIAEPPYKRDCKTFLMKMREIKILREGIKKVGKDLLIEMKRQDEKFTTVFLWQEILSQSLSERKEATTSITETLEQAMHLQNLDIQIDQTVNLLNNAMQAFTLDEFKARYGEDKTITFVEICNKQCNLIEQVRSGNINISNTKLGLFSHINADINTWSEVSQTSTPSYRPQPMVE